MRATIYHMSTLASAPLIDLIASGGKNPEQLLPAIWSNVEVRTNATPSIDAAISYDPSAPPSPLLQWLRPTVILTGPAGRTVIAPYGEAGGSGGLVAAGVLLGIVGIGFLLGRLSK